MKLKVLYLLLSIVSLASCQSTRLESVKPLDPPVDNSNAVYNVTFMDDDGELLANVKVKDGETAVYPYDLPKDKSTETEYYKFIGWDESLEDIHSNLVVNAHGEYQQR